MLTLCAPAGAVPERLPPIDPARSLTGWQLALLVNMKRGDIEATWQAFEHAIALAPHDLSFLPDGLHYATMSGHVEKALPLARALPADDISILLLSETALLHKDAPALYRVLSRTNRPDALISTILPVLDAWALAQEGHAQRAVTRLSDAPGDPISRKLYLANAALISEQLPDTTHTEALFHAAALTARDPIGLRIVLGQLYAQWLHERGRPAEASTVNDITGGDLPPGTVPTDRLARLSVRPAAETPDHEAADDVASGLAFTDLQLGLMLAMEARKANIRSDLAINMLQISHYANPSLDITNILLAEVMRTDHHHADALRVLARVSDASPFAALAIQERIQITAQTHDLPEEEKALRQELRISPNNPDYLAQLGSVQQELGRFDAAIASYTRALAASPPRKTMLAPLLLSRATAWQEKNDWAHTRDDMQHALALTPDDPMVLNFVGYASLEHDSNPARAMAYLKRAFDMSPTDFAIQDSYAWGLLKENADLDHALPILIRAVEHEPNDPEIAYHLGVAYWYLGRRLEAQDQWNQALADDPEPHDRALLNAALRYGPHLASFERSK